MRKQRKLTDARQEKLDRVHTRDCPAWRSIELSCLTCVEIRQRKWSKNDPRH